MKSFVLNEAFFFIKVEEDIVRLYITYVDDSLHVGLDKYSKLSQLAK